MSSKLWRYAVLLLAISLVAAACGGDDADDEDTATTAASGDTTAGDGGTTGQIVVSGSSTVEPITARVGEAFDGTNPGVATSVEGPGTGDGFARFCNGETDISDASRPISEEEVANCEANGIDFVELKVAVDGLSVITAVANEAVSCLSFADLYALLGPESEGFGTWDAANDLAAEIGAANAPYPAADLVITAPGEESGTYDSFVEIAIGDIAEERGQEEQTRADYNASANDNVIIQGVADNPTSLGWVGYAFFEENAETVKALEIDGGDGCVAPTAETISSTEYPIARDLFIYVATGDLADRSDLVAFVDYYLSDEGMAFVSEAGYVDLDDASLEATRSAWETAKG